MHIYNSEHLGDGAYVSRTDEGIVFTANHHHPDIADHAVYLDFYAIDVLERWIKAQRLLALKALENQPEPCAVQSSNTVSSEDGLKRSEAKRGLDSCPNCGGRMLGDGVTFVKHCEESLEEDYACREPDSTPVHCRKRELPEELKGVPDGETP
jgi:hypothetical protein